MAQKHIWEGLMQAFIGITMETDDGEIDLEEAFEEAGLDGEYVRITVEVLESA